MTTLRNLAALSASFIIAAAIGGCSSHSSSGSPDSNTNVNSSRAFSTVLSNKNVNSIVQDSDGFIWIGTFRGLNRFDSVDYLQFFKGNAEGELRGNQVYDLVALPDGDVLIGAVNLTRYSRADDSFHYYAQPDSVIVRDILQAKDGGLFFTDQYGLYRLNDAGDSLVQALPKPAEMFSAYFMGVDNEVWRFSGPRLTKLIIGSDEEVDYNLPLQPIFYAETHDGDIWLSDGKRMCVFNTVLRRHMDVPDAVAAVPELTGSSLNTVASLGDGRVLFNTSSGSFYLYDIQSETVVEGNDPAFPFELPPFSDIDGVFVDRDKNIWFYSNDQGFFVSNANHGIFNANDDEFSYLSDNTIVSIAYSQSNNTLIMASKQGGVFLLDRNTSKVTYLDDVEERQLMMDRNDEWLWSLSADGALFQQWKVNPTSLTLLHEYDVFQPLSIAQDSDGTIWMGCPYRYIQYLERGSNEVKLLATSTETTKFFFTPTLLPLSDGTLMVASSGHFPIFIDKNLQFNSGLLDDDVFSKELAAPVFVPTAAYQDADGIIWLGTVGSGLFRIDPSNGSIKALDGEPCDDISGILEDEAGHLWISTMNGIGRLDKSTLTFTNYQIEDGIGGNQFVDRAECILPDGTLLFGGNHGVTMFKPGGKTDVQNIPVCFEGLRINNTQLHRSLMTGKDLVLTHKDRNVAIQYVALNYNSDEQMRYSYILDGFDPDWVSVGMNREANYSNLPAGKYVFRVMASTPSGSVSSDVLSLRIRVKPAPWRSWWALLIYALLIGATTDVLLRHFRRVAKIRETAERAEREEQFFTNVAHEFRSPLTMISGPLSMLEQKDDLSVEEKKLVEVAQRSSRWMLQLVDQFLDVEMIKNDKQSLGVRRLDVMPLLRDLAEVYANAAQLKGVSVVTEGLDLPYEMPVDPDKLSKIVTNLLSNALKFTPSGGLIKLRFDTVPSGKVEISVTDTGSGVPDALKKKIFERYFQVEKNGYNKSIGSGIGLYYSHNLAELHHGRLWVEDNPAGCGSCFKLHLPADDAAYAKGEWDNGPVAELPEVIHHPAPVSLPDNVQAGKPKVLVVDDDVDIANYVKFILSGSYDVSCCYDAQSALRLLAEGDLPELIVSDVMMPQKDGFEFCRDIRADVQLSHIPVILCTAKTSVEDKILGLETGADAYVTKPFDPKYLLALVKSLLDTRNKIQKTISQSTSVESIDDQVLPPQDKAFLERLFALIDESLSDSDLDVDMLAERMGISRTKFYYKVKGLTGESPAVLLRNSRLNKSVTLIREGKFNLSEIADMVGFTSLSQFSVSFKKQFGVTPRDFR